VENPCAEIARQCYGLSLSDGERLLIMAEKILEPPERFIVAVTPMTDHQAAYVRTAIDFYRAPAVLRFRAIAEDWNLVRINREMY
jgi:hypothetical protein